LVGLRAGIDSKDFKFGVRRTNDVAAVVAVVVVAATVAVARLIMTEFQGRTKVMRSDFRK
jgi:hypothetical protein